MEHFEGFENKMIIDNEDFSSMRYQISELTKTIEILQKKFVILKGKKYYNYDKVYVCKDEKSYIDKFIEITTIEEFKELKNELENRS